MQAMASNCKQLAHEIRPHVPDGNAKKGFRFAIDTILERKWPEYTGEAHIKLQLRQKALLKFLPFSAHLMNSFDCFDLTGTNQNNSEAIRIHEAKLCAVSVHKKSLCHSVAPFRTTSSDTKSFLTFSRCCMQ